MRWRVMVVKTFTEEDEARDFWHDVTVMWPKTGTLPDDKASLHKCFHDEDPVEPCEILEELP